MRPGAARVLACPKCGRWLRCQALDLTRRLGTTVWSDLRVEDGFWQTPSRLAACPHCAIVLCKETAEYIGVLPSSAEELSCSSPHSAGWRRLFAWRDTNDLIEQFRSAPPVAPLTAEAVELALAGSSERDEVELRLQLWRLHNDVRRNTGNGHAVPDAYRGNVLRLLTLIRPVDEYHCLLAAELHRQLGHFHAAMAQLSYIRESFGREKAAMLEWVIENNSDLHIYH